MPQNYDRRFKGWVSARTALASSLNVPAVRTLVMVTPDAFFSQLQRLGLPLQDSVVTYLVRGERFADGHVAAAIENSKVGRMLDRLTALVPEIR